MFLVQEFWQKALYIELAGKCHDLAPMSPPILASEAPTGWPCKMSRYIFPASSRPQVLKNLPSLSLEGAVTVDQSLRSAISQDVVSVGSTIHDTAQQFSTLVLKA